MIISFTVDSLYYPVMINMVRFDSNNKAKKSNGMPKKTPLFAVHLKILNSTKYVYKKGLVNDYYAN